VTTGHTSGDSDIAALAAAMVRHMLPAVPSLRLEVTRDHSGVWLHLTYPTHGPAPASPSRSSAGDLPGIDSAALRWGHYGDSDWHTLWALLPAPADVASARADDEGG